MKMKSDRTKLAEKRCLGEGPDYTGFILARESGSIGTAVSVYDPIAGRKVELLSQGEAELFWIIRFRDGVKEIKEQMMLAPEIVAEICTEFEFRKPSHILSTDLLVEYENGNMTAYSVKSDRSALFQPNLEPRKQRRILERQKIEQEYWRRHGAEFKIVFRTDLNPVYTRNVEAAMAFYDPRFVNSEEDMLKYLVAHKKIRIDMENGPVPYARLCRELPDIKARYRMALRDGNTGQIRLEGYYAEGN